MQKSRIDILNGGSGKQIGNEKGEQKIVGRSHAKGGVDVKHASGEDYELEGGEVVDGDRVFSVKLKSQSGESFAAVAESFLKAKKKANDALKVASAANKDKIRKKIRAIEEELSALFAEQQEMNGDSNGEYAAEGTEMGTETLQLETPEATTTGTVEQPVMETTTSTADQIIGGGGDPLSDMYDAIKKSSKTKDYFKSFDDFKAQFTKDKEGISKVILDSSLGTGDYDVFKSKINTYFKSEGREDISKKLGVYTPGKTISEEVITKATEELYPEKPGMGKKSREQIFKEARDREEEKKRKEEEEQKKRLDPLYVLQEDAAKANAAISTGQTSVPDSNEKVNAILEARNRDEAPKEVDYFQGSFGAALKAIDSDQNPLGFLGIGDLIDDWGRAIGTGINQGLISNMGNNFMIKGKELSDQEIQEYVDAANEYRNIGPSDEMIQFSNTYENEGGGVFGFLKALWENPKVAPEIVISSMAGLLNPQSAAAATSVVGGAATGAAAVSGGTAAIPAALASVPYAIAAAGTLLETGSSFSEFLNEELEKRGLEFNANNVKTILEDEKALNNIRVKSATRGATIGAIDALTGRVAGSVGAKLTGNTVAAKIKSALIPGVIEATGAGLGEAGAITLTGGTPDAMAVGSEVLGEVTMGAIPTAAQLKRNQILGKPTYLVNGEQVDETTLNDVINNASPEDLSSIKFEFKNDDKGYDKKVIDKIADGEIKKEVVQANPGVNETTIDQIVSLEKELKALETNKTQSGKDRANAIKNQIKSIQETATTKQPKEEVTAEVSEIKTQETSPESGAVVREEIAPGKKLFNEPNPKAAEVELKYKEEKGIDTPEPKKIEKLDEEKSKSIADAYDQLENNPNDPEVKEAYQAMADETMDQFKAIEDSGVKVELWTGEGEPYKNSAEMIADVRDNNHMYVFSTEEGFGSEGISDTQREENPLLKDSGVKDVNGRTLLVNDIFRFVHDYFGHTRLGNAFGPIGEENAWNVHARMYSPKARRAMTTETRGQNSWVNFNNSMRNSDGTIKKKGDPGYVPPSQRPFADQKIALLPEEFSNIEESYSETTPTEAAPTVEPIQLEKEVYTTEDINKLAAASDKIKNPIAKKIVTDAANVIKALQSLAKTKVNIHTTRESYNQSMDNNLTEEDAAMGRGTTGYYIDSKGEIHISLPDIESNTIYHEAAHPVLNFLMKQDPAVVNRMSKQVESLGKSNKSVQEVVDWSNEEYSVEVAKEEKIVEFIARVADGRIDLTTLNKSAFEKVKNIINEMLGLLLGDNAPVLSTVDEVISAAQTISEAFKTGRELQAQELETKQIAAAKRKKPAAPKKKERVVLEEVEDIKEMIDTKDSPKKVSRKVSETPKVKFKKPEKGVVLVPKKYKIDTDGEGNFLFYHYGKIKGEKIDPKYFGKNRYTSDQRRNGVSYFYTKSTDQESMVSGDVNVIKVPMEKVYPFNKDPLNFYDQAEANFRKDFPNGAFDAVKQIDYMNPLIQEAGFDMTVAEWSTFPLRAETTKALPIDKKLTEAMREFGGFSTKDMRDKYEIDIVNKISDAAQKPTRKGEIIAEKFYGMGGSDASVTKLMKDRELRAVVGKPLFDKWNNTLPESKKVRFKKPEQRAFPKMEQSENMIGEKTGKWTLNNGFTIEESGLGSDKVFIIKQNGKKWATGLTLAQARSMVNNRARFKKPEKKYGDTIQRYMLDPNQPQMIRDIIENTSDLDFSGVKFPVINNLADRIIADALANNELDKLVTDLESVSSSKDVSGPLKVFILQKALEVAKVADMPNLAQKILIKLNEISSTAARTLRSLASNTIPESVMYSLRDRLNTARNKKLGKKKLEALENLYSEIQDILDSSIDESLNSAEIEALILKAINEGQVFPMTLEEFNNLKGEIASLKAQLQSAINNARATSPSNIYGVNLGSVQNNTVTNASTGQSRTVNDIMTELATKIMMRGNVTEKSFKQEVGVMLRKMGILATDAEVKGYYDSARNNPDVQEKLAQAGTAKGKARAQEISEKALKDLLSQVKARIAEYAKNHWNGNATQARNFKNEILEIFGPNSPIAQEIADKLEEVFNNKVKEAAEKVIQKELGSRKIPTPKQVKEAQSITQKILGHIYAGENAGVLDTDMFINLFADKYGFTGLTQEQMDVLKEFADVMAYTAPGSAERKKWMARMELYVKKITTPKWRFVLGVFAMENFYSAVLSGYTTFWRASTGVIYTSLGELAVEAMVQQIQNPKGLMGKNGLMSGLKKMLDGFKNQSWDQAKQYMKDGVPINNKFEAVQTGTIVEAYNSDKERESLKGKNIAAYIGSKVFRSIYWPVAMMARSIGAMDALITAPLREYYAKNAAMNELLREGMDQNDANFFKEMEKLLYRDEASVKQARQQAEEEYAALKALDPRLKKLGFRTSSNYINQRTYEILDSYRDAYIQEYSEDMQVRSRLMGTPTGTAGVLYESVTYLQRKFPGFTYIVPFARVPLNALNEWVSWSPYGLVRGVLGKGAISRTLRSTLESPVDHLKFGKTLWDVKGSPKEARENVRDLVKGVLGSAIMAIPLMIAMTAKTGDEEEEPERGGTPMKTWMDLPFRVTSDKPENVDYRYINELKERNLWFPNSFRIKIGKFDSGWIGYLDMPFAASLAPAGYIMDNKFITTKPKGERIFDDKGTMDQIAMGMMPYATFMKNQSFIKGVVDFATIFADERVPQEKGFSWAKTGAATLRFGTGIAKGLIYPNFYKQSYITYKSIVGEEQKVPYRMSDADMDPARYINESMAYNFPFWEDAIENKAYDSFGLPVPYDIAYNRIGDAVLNNVMWNYVLPNTPMQWIRSFYASREGNAAWDFVIDRQLEIPRIPGDGELSFDDNIKFKKLALGKFYEKFKWHMDNSYSDNTVELLKLKDYEAKKDIQDVMSVMAKIGMTYAKDQMLLDTAKTEEQRKLILNLLEYQTIQDLENGTVDRWLLYNPQINKLIMESPTIERETKMETRPSRINE